MGLDSDVWAVRERLWAGLLTVGVVGTALVPMRQFRRPVPQRVDGFPLSYFPMFSYRLGQYWDLYYAVGVRADGSRFSLPHYVLGPAGVNQVRKQLIRAVKQGRAGEHARLLAAQVAERPDCADVVRVEIVSGCFDLDACMLQRRVQVHGEETVLAGADVPRAPHATAAPNVAMDTADTSVPATS
jgi:hypothetical protein